MCSSHRHYFFFFFFFQLCYRTALCQVTQRVNSGPSFPPPAKGYLSGYPTTGLPGHYPSCQEGQSMAGNQGHTLMVKEWGRDWRREAWFPTFTPPLLPSCGSSVLTLMDTSFTILSPPPILSGRRQKNRKSTVDWGVTCNIPKRQKKPGTKQITYPYLLNLYGRIHTD